MNEEKEQIVTMTCLQLFGKPKVPQWKQLNPFTRYPLSLDAVFDIERNYAKTFTEGKCETCEPSIKTGIS